MKPSGCAITSSGLEATMASDLPDGRNADGSVPPVPAGEPLVLRPAETAETDTAATPIATLPPIQGRLHPLTLAFAGWNAVRGFIVPAVAVLLFGNEFVAGAMLLAALSVNLCISLIRYFTFSYRLHGDELVTVQGILERTERHIPLERVQDIRIEQGVLHRVFGVVDVHVETAGGKGPEASLSVLSRDEAERLRRAVFERPRGAPGQVHSPAMLLPTADVVRQLRVGELALAGLTSNRMASVLVFFFAIWALADDLLPKDVYERVAATALQQVRILAKQDARTAALVVLIGAMAILSVCVCLSVVGSVVLFYGFTLSRRGEDLHRAYGLLTRRSSSLPRRRIQVLEIEEGLLRRLFGLATLRADTAGGAGAEEPGAGAGGRDVLLPVLRREEVDRFLPLFLPDLEAGAAEWRRVSRRAIGRGTRKAAFFVVVLTAAALLFHRHWVGLWPMCLIAPAYAINVARYRHLGYLRGDRYFRTRRGWLSRSTHVVPVRNAQTIVLRQSPFDRRLGLATLIVDTAGQNYTNGGPRISNLPADEAAALARSLAHQAARTRYRW
jgi:putative membrane protein